jgi:hypothetical protein
MQGNVVQIIRPEKAGYITDITFYNDQLVVFQPQSYDKLTFYQDSTCMRKIFVDFYASNEKELTSRTRTFYFGAAEYLMTVNGQLYFDDGKSFFSFSNLRQIKVTTHQTLINKNVEVFVNQGLQKPINGYPISDCKIVRWVLDRQLPKDKYSFDVIDFCNDTTTTFISKPLPNDTCNNCNVSMSCFFKNEYLSKYFFVGAQIRITATSRELDRIVVFLDENFDVENICHSIEYLQNYYGLSPHEMASFTYDELGNVYYCTNYLDYSNKSNSYVKIFKKNYPR